MTEFIDNSCADAEVVKFDHIVVHFENRPISAGIINVHIPIKEPTFGILNLHAAKVEVSDLPLELVFTVDCSGSMSDKCSDGRTKNQHIVHTLKNMVIYFSENINIHAYITVFAFDIAIYNIVERTTVTLSNIDEILVKIDKIRPNGSTNIELALNNFNEYVPILNSYSCGEINHIFMTDGDATEGCQDANELRGIVNNKNNEKIQNEKIKEKNNQDNQNKINNIFIGFGIDHNSKLLNTISCDNNSSYHFIDNLEKSGFVYGEILHGIAYKCLVDMEISIHNGLIYNYKSNLWTDTLFVGNIVGETNKIFHLISSDPDECMPLIITGKTMTGEKYSRIIEKHHVFGHRDLTKYIFRQKTLQMLFEARQKNVEPDMCLLGLKYQDVRVIQQEAKHNNKLIKNKMMALLEEMKTYITCLPNDSKDVKFMKLLCDDIYISYKTFGTKYGEMYTCARQTSQGTQRCYTVTHTPENNNNVVDADTFNNNNNQYFTPRRPSCGLQRQNSGICAPAKLCLDLVSDNDNDNNHSDSDNDNNNNSSIDSILKAYQMSDMSDTPYTTPIGLRVMRSISSGRGDAYISTEEEEEEEETQSNI